MKIEIMGGTSINEAAQQMCSVVRGNQEDVTAEFNGILLFATLRTKPADIVKQLDDGFKKERAAYVASPQYAIDQEKEKERPFAQHQERDHLISSLPAAFESDAVLLDWLCAAENNGSMDWGFIKTKLEARGFVKNHGCHGIDHDSREDVFRYIVGQCAHGEVVPQVIHSFVERWKRKFCK